jgi:hypothetical protein
MLERFERAVARLVEGSVAGVFRLRVQPAEIGRRLERAMLDRRVTSVGAVLAPNQYEVRLHPDDAAAFLDWEDALCREMETWLAELAYAKGLVALGPIRVRIVADPSVRRRSVAAEARFARGSADAALIVAPQHDRLWLVPVTLEGSAVPLVGDTITVGRAASNDLVLADAAVSRQHARLEPGADGWQVVDLGSMNGTWVNGTRVRQSAVAPGDEVAFGGARFTVVVR